MQTIFKTTAPSDDVIKTINDMVGEPYSIWKKVKMGGAGSRRMVIKKVSDHFLELLNPGHYSTKASIELRPRGILVFINKGLETFTWAIPFHHLMIFRSDTLSIHSGDKLIRFMHDYPENSGFIRKIQALKTEAYLNPKPHSSTE